MSPGRLAKRSAKPQSNPSLLMNLWILRYKVNPFVSSRQGKGPSAASLGVSNGSFTMEARRKRRGGVLKWLIMSSGSEWILNMAWDRCERRAVKDSMDGSFVKARRRADSLSYSVRYIWAISMSNWFPVDWGRPEILIISYDNYNKGYLLLKKAN